MSKVVVVTGASAGVGRAVSQAFGERGAAVGLLARGRDGLEAAAKEVEANGGRALAVPTDVADAAAVEEAAARIESELGPIDVWVNNAMVSVFALFTDITPDEFRRVTDVTYHGYVNGTRAALRRMLPRMADHPRREMWLTERTVLAIVGNRLFPGYLDRKLGRGGVASQQTDEPAEPERPANLWHPVPGDHGAHGSFDARSRRGSRAVWASIHRRALTIAGLGSLGMAAAIGAARRIAR